MMAVMTPPTLLGDPDTYIAWTKIDEPGENTKWESQCGLVEQIGYGDSLMYQGFVGPEKTPTQPKSNFATVKRDVEFLFKKNHDLKWAYDD